MKKKISRKKELDDSGFRDWAYMSLLWEKRHELIKKDPSDLGFREQQILSQKFFDDGNIIESFIVLHGLIEIHLNRVWQVFMAFSGFFDEPRVEPKPRSYSELTELLHEAGILDKESHQVLNDFNAHRNLLSHNLFGIKKKKRTSEQTKDIFEKGLGVSGDLPLLLVKFLYHETKKNPKLKKMLNKEFGGGF